ncbi:MAG: SpoIID/LytB domain-containing protein [Cyanobacteria bacterium SZAS LIN-2]|nr:SpoIID/LytB domain-containing protein [Cyanobacteria bacterium SZAS LIN-2]
MPASPAPVDSASDEELVAIAAAVEAYIAIDDALYMQNAGADKDLSLSSWLSDGRLRATRSFQLPGWSRGGTAARPTLWRNFFSIAFLALSSHFYFAPEAVAQASNSLPPANNPSSFYGTWSYKEEGQTVRVLIGAPAQKVDLDLPDGGSIFAADGSLVARVGPRSSWTLNLAKLPSSGDSSASGPRQIATGNGGAAKKKVKFVFAGKSQRDIATTKVSGGLSVERVAFVPSGAVPPENRFALTGEGGYLVVPDARSTEGAVPLVGLNGKLYRGSLLLRPSVSTNADGSEKSTAIAVINIVRIEDYLLSVVPSEVPSSWPQEALKAQAIAARSYVVANLGKHRADGYDVKDTVEDQVYRGVASENNETNVACAATTGLVLKQNAQVISAFFHSTSGGSTELPENVWGKPLPYLKSVVDFDDAAPLFTWNRTFTVAQLNKLLGMDAADQLSGLLVVGRHKSNSQRVKHMIAVGSSSARVLTGTELRRLLNLPSTQFSVLQSDGAYVFSGRGFGHGLGLSQWGAKALADKGYNAGQILSYYYKDVTIESMGESIGTNGSI